MADINSIKAHIIKIMEDQLPSVLYYHNIEHTLYVEKQALSIAASENISNLTDLEDLQIAALYHDAGFIKIHYLHEMVSCEYARQYLPAFGIDTKRIDNICDLIMATKFPHQPKNILQEIICDADLDYIGRDGFTETSEKLRKELLAYQIIDVQTNWIQYQIDFFKKHRFYTKTSISERLPIKEKHLIELENLNQQTRSNLI